MELLKAARYANNNGDPKRAMSIVNSIIGENPDTPAATEAEKMLSMLQGRKHTPRNVNPPSSTDAKSTSSSPSLQGSNGNVVITDVRLPFGRMVMLLVKIALASIPAVIIVTVVVIFAWGIAGGILAGLQ